MKKNLSFQGGVTQCSSGLWSFDINVTKYDKFVDNNDQILKLASDHNLYSIFFFLNMMQMPNYVLMFYMF